MVSAKLQDCQQEVNVSLPRIVEFYEIRVGLRACDVGTAKTSGTLHSLRGPDLFLFHMESNLALCFQSGTGHSLWKT